ncbi:MULTISPECIES: hypothetical protein [Aeromonas]|uniref:hypothetical protein n=1 Tax=Aeromonas TaxID=642 RepID=UPI002240B731|nr:MULTISPECIES: hypothetical protein [Aeromonas]
MQAASSLKTYNSLAQCSQQQPEVLGCQLPTLTRGHLQIESRRDQREELSALLAKWQQAEGWYQTASQLALGLPTHTAYLLEGQWHQNGNSLHIQHEFGTTYRITLLNSLGFNGNSNSHGNSSLIQAYREQRLVLRQDLPHAQGRELVYRLWWQQGQTATTEGLWQPLVQQFTGFAQGDK